MPPTWEAQKGKRQSALGMMSNKGENGVRGSSRVDPHLFSSDRWVERLIELGHKPSTRGQVHGKFNRVAKKSDVSGNGGKPVMEKKDRGGKIIKLEGRGLRRKIHQIQ